MFYTYKFSVNIVKFLILLLFVINISFDTVRCDVTSSNNKTSDGNWNGTDYRFLVIGGYRPAIQSLNKYVVSLRNRQEYYFGANHFCAGTIITRKVVLTAAHCVVRLRGSSLVKMSPSDLFVVAGTPKRLEKTSKTQKRYVEYLIVHSEYKQRFTHDIALIFLLKEIMEDGETAERASLPHQPVPPRTVCTVIGWGSLFDDGPMPNEIIYVDLNVLEWKECEPRHPFGTDDMMCLIGEKDDFKSACSGDSGGPLFLERTIVGVLSASFVCGIRDPTFVTDVFYYKTWIEKNIMKGSQERSVEEKSGAIKINISAFIQFIIACIILNFAVSVNL